MTIKDVTIINPTGLHARPATELVHKAKEFKSSIKLQNLSNPAASPANAKSLVGVLTLSAVCGTELSITADGEDEIAAVEALTALISSRFGE